MNYETYQRLLADLVDESDHLTEVLSSLTVGQWQIDTAARGWTIHDQVTHLAFFDDCAHSSLRSPQEFRATADRLMADGMDFPDRVAEDHRSLAPHDALSWFIDARRKLLHAFSEHDFRARLPWFGPDMSTASCATARLMETWAHGCDVYEALGMKRPASSGLHSIAHLGVSTFAFSHTIHGLVVPDEPVHVELRSATGDLWRWGPVGAANRVYGPAEDFALVVTQRRHWTETALIADGPVARQWLDIAQAFAGAPTRRVVPQ